MTDILKVTESQARVLRAIAYYEVDSHKKGSTQYLCYNKVPKEFRVSGSTFNDNIKFLERKLMVTRLEGSDTKRETKPYTITDIGQVAWLRYFPLSENVDIIKKIFPNIQLSAIDTIINQIDHPGIKYIKNIFAIGVLRIALDSFHIEDPGFTQISNSKILIKEEIELTGFNGLMKTSYARFYNIIDPLLLKKIEKIDKEFSRFTKNFDELQISVIDRITFLFYYNLIQSVTNTSSLGVFVRLMSLGFNEITNSEELESLGELLKLQKELVKKKSEILEKITSNDIVNKIIQDNLKDLNEYKDTYFQNISEIFLK
jgi:DNA-binding MarR family transcriptional regulator